jgi:hypothetical protein
MPTTRICLDTVIKLLDELVQILPYLLELFDVHGVPPSEIMNNQMSLKELSTPWQREP